MNKTRSITAALRVGDEGLNGTAATPDNRLRLEFTPAQAALLAHSVDGLIKQLSQQPIGHCEHDVRCAAQALAYMHKLTGKAAHYAEDQGVSVFP